MKFFSTIFFFVTLTSGSVQAREIATGYFPSGSKIVEIKLDTKDIERQKSIETIYEQNFRRIERLYKRALLEDPTEKGKITFEIAPNQAKEKFSCKVVSSELNSRALEQRVCAIQNLMLRTYEGVLVKVTLHFEV